MAKKYYWLKLKDDFFRSKEIKKLRKISGGDTFTIIYLKMQLLSIKKSGIIEFDGTEEDLAEQLALELDEGVEDVKLTLSFMGANKLIESICDESYLLSRVPELIGSETDAAERMRKMRNNVTKQLPDVTQRKEKIKELEKDIDIEEPIVPIDYKTIVDYLNTVCKTSYRSSGKKTKDLIQARINEGFTTDDFKKVIDVKAAEWLNSDMSKFLRPETLFSNKFEGYLNQKPETKVDSKNKFTNFDQRENKVPSTDQLMNKWKVK